MTRDPDADLATLLTIEKVLILKGVSIFSAIAEQELVEVAYIAEEEEVSAGDPIIRRGELGTSLYVIVSGSVRVHVGEMDIARLGERQVFGELAALDPEPRSADVTALEDTLMLRIESGALYDLMAQYAAVTRGVIAVLCDRIRRETARTTNLEGSPT
jgi:CRP-like cAMP-binding protein